MILITLITYFLSYFYDCEIEVVGSELLLQKLVSINYSTIYCNLVLKGVIWKVL
jgi:hypothetical protein